MPLPPVNAKVLNPVPVQAAAAGYLAGTDPFDPSGNEPAALRTILDR